MTITDLKKIKRVYLVKVGQPKKNWTWSEITHSDAIRVHQFINFCWYILKHVEMKHGNWADWQTKGQTERKPLVHSDFTSIALIIYFWSSSAH